MNLLRSIATIPQEVARTLSLDVVSEKRALVPASRHRAQRSYAGGATNRLTGDWLGQYTAIDADIRSNIVAVRERARDLTKNNDIARRWMNLCRANIVGPVGFKLQMNILERRGSEVVQDEYANTSIETKWTDFTRAQNCSVSGQQTFREICDQLVQYRKRDGEAFLRIIRRNKSKYGILLQVVPPEMVPENYNTKTVEGTFVKMGVEMDVWRRPSAYYLRKRSIEQEVQFTAGMSGGTYDRVPADEVLHWYHQEYADQSRGISDMAPVMLRLKMLSGYEEAAVINARASASKMGFLTDGEDGPSDYVGDEVDESGNPIAEFAPGTIQDIGSKTFAQFDPKYPSDMHQSFVTTEGKMIAAGLNVAYASLTNDLSEANYSSNRVGLLDEREMWKIQQAEFVDRVLQPLFEIWLDTALSRGAIGLPAEKFDKFNAATWAGRRWAWIDPLKDISAEKEELALGLASPYAKAAERGEDLADIYRDIASAQKLATKYGLSFNFTGAKSVDPLTLPPDEGKKGRALTQYDEQLDALLLANRNNGNGKH